MSVTTDIQAMVTALQADLQLAIADLVTWRPTTFTPADVTPYVPLAVDAYDGSGLLTKIDAAAAGLDITIDTTLDPIEITDISDISAGLKSPSDFTGTAPTLDVSGLPSPVMPTAPTAPTVSLGAVPNAPAVTLPGAPSLTDVPIPSPPSLGDLPTFAGSAPDISDIEELPYQDNPLASFDGALYKQRVYQSAILDTLEQQLLLDIQEGRVGIPVAVEQQIWERGAERDLMAVNRSLKLAGETFAKRGFGLPPGRLDAKRQEILTEYTNLSNDRSREISEKQAALTQENRKNAIDQLLKSEATNMEFATRYMAIMLDIAKETVNAGIAIYNSRVAKFNAQLEAYKTDADVFATRIRAYGLQLDVYQGELQAAKLRGDLNMQQIEIYKGMISAQEFLVNVYKAEVDAFAAASGVEKLKVDIYRAQVDALDGQIKLALAEYQGYDAKIRGEEAKIKGFEAQVLGYKAETEGKSENNKALSVKVEAEGRRAAAQAQRAQAEIARFGALVEAARAQGSINAQTLDAKTRGILAEIDVARINKNVEAENVRASTEAYRALEASLTSRIQIIAEQVKAENQVHVDAQKVAGELIKGLMLALNTSDSNITVTKLAAGV